MLNKSKHSILAVMHLYKFGLCSSPNSQAKIEFINVVKPVKMKLSET